MDVIGHRQRLQTWGLALMCLLGMGVPWVSAQAQAVQITDARGVQVRWAQPPQRIVSLLPSLTESICALGACARLVGVDRYSNWPAHVKTVPVVGGGLDPNLEAIAALRPDVVLVSMASRSVARMQALGLRVVALEPRTHAEAHTVLQTLGHMLAVPAPQGADKVWGEIQAQIQAATASIPASMRGKRVYFEASRGPFAAGENSFIGETLTLLGMRNIVTAALGPFPRINPEYVVRADPDVVMGGTRSLLTAGEPYPGWSQMRAFQTGRVCRFNSEESDVLIRPGPRMADGAQLMARCLREVAP